MYVTGLRNVFIIFIRQPFFVQHNNNKITLARDENKLIKKVIISVLFKHNQEQDMVIKSD